MEPVTHLLTGTVLARTGFNRRAAYATVAMAIAAEFPDIDTLWSAGGPLVGFEHHRGITHTFLGLPFEAALITLGFWTYHRLRGRPGTKAPERWGVLFGLTLLALLSHLFLDWTNNYGLRPFFPFNPAWYAGSFVFIFEPVIFLLLVLALMAPLLFGLVNAEVGSRKPLFAGRGWAVFGLLAVCAGLDLRAGEHAKAIHLVSQNPPLPADQGSAPVTRVFASPSPGDPFTWHMIVDTPGFLPARHGRYPQWNHRSGHARGHAVQACTHPAHPAAKRTGLGRIYLDWSQYPVLTESTDTNDARHPLAIVTFSDARFLTTLSCSRGEHTRPSREP